MTSMLWTVGRTPVSLRISRIDDCTSSPLLGFGPESRSLVSRRSRYASLSGPVSSSNAAPISPIRVANTPDLTSNAGLGLEAISVQAPQAHEAIKAVCAYDAEFETASLYESS